MSGDHLKRIEIVNPEAGRNAIVTGKATKIGGVFLPTVIGKPGSHGESYRGIDILNAHKKFLLYGNDLTRRSRLMSEDIDKATEIADTAVERFSKSLARLDQVHESFVSKGRKVSGEVRDTAERLSQGLSRVEKAANFDRLERYVELLERASVAMQALAELEATGKLDKIATAIR